MAQKGKSSAGNIFMTIVWIVLGTVLAVAVLRAFDWNLFGVINWVVGWFSYVVGYGADLLTGNPTFQDLTTVPDSQ